MAVLLSMFVGAPRSLAQAADRATLTNGSGDGSVSVTVDAYGSFGSSTPAGDAFYDPPGSIGPAGTTWESGIYFSPLGDFLTTDSFGAGLPLLDFSSASDSTAVSDFAVAGFSVHLTQTLGPVGSRGSVLTQDYQITNATGSAQTLVLGRYFEGDLLLVNSFGNDLGASSGDGRFLYQIDPPDDPSIPTPLVGITTEGGEPSGFMVQPYRFTQDIVASGGIPAAVLNQVFADDNGDRISDIGFDAGLFLQDVLVLPSGATMHYVTRTVFDVFPYCDDPMCIATVRPKRGGNTGEVSLSVQGAGLVDGVTLRLHRVGHEDIVALRTTLVANGFGATARFDLTGAPAGAWSVLAVNPDGSEASLVDGFEIEQGGQPDVWVDIVGRDAIRIGAPQTFTLMVGNRGSVNAYGVPVWFAGIPKGATVELGFEIFAPPQAPGVPPLDPPADWSTVPVVIENDTEQLLPLFLGSVPAGATLAFPIHLTVPSEDEFTLRAWAHEPFFRSPISSQAVACASSVVGFALAGLGVVPGIGCAGQLGIWLGSIASQIANLAADDAVTGADGAWSSAQITADLTALVAQCAGAPVGVSTAFSLVAAALAFGDVRSDCFGDRSSESDHPVDPVASLDPNEKTGASGIGSPRFVSGEEPQRYVVAFENVAMATAPAQEVVITDQLDPLLVDLSSFSLGQISFGDIVLAPPLGAVPYSTDVDLRPQSNLIVRVDAGLNLGTSLVTWRLRAIDPDTGLPPEDPLAGFLPPNVDPPEGEGSVLFTVMPRADLPTGTEIRNQATIVFDANAPIETCVSPPDECAWLNTLDNDDPRSEVLTLASPQGSPRFAVEWSGTDVGSGVKDFSIYVSEAAGPFTAWLTNTTATSAIFEGTGGGSYAFYSRARDNVGNSEEPPEHPDAMASIVACPLDVDGNGTADVSTDVVYVARRLLGLVPVPPPFRAIDPMIPADADITAKVDAIGVALDVDGRGGLDVATDIVYLARHLLGLPVVPTSFRAIDPTIPSDATIRVRVDALCP